MIGEWKVLISIATPDRSTWAFDEVPHGGALRLKPRAAISSPGISNRWTSSCAWPVRTRLLAVSSPRRLSSSHDTKIEYRYDFVSLT